MLEALVVAGVQAIAADDDHPMFLPHLNGVLNVYQPNADTVYKRATISPGGSYRLRGHRGSVHIAKIGALFPFEADGTIRAADYYDLNDLDVAVDGSFDVVLSPTRPAGHTGDWWQLDPKANALLLRQVAYDWADERDALVSIERLDGPATRPRPSASDLESRLRKLAPAAGDIALYLVDHVEKLRHEGYVNRFKIWDVVANHGGLFGQFYYECVYELADDEALVLETEVPDDFDYASLILTNHVFETTDWYNNHSSLNARQWQVDPDGRLRVVIAAQDPAVPNWLDTAGYPVGVIQGRWTDSTSTPLPSLRKVSVAQVRECLPVGTGTVTPQEREDTIRQRRAHYQQRVFW